MSENYIRKSANQGLSGSPYMSRSTFYETHNVSASAIQPITKATNTDFSFASSANSMLQINVKDENDHLLVLENGSGASLAPVRERSFRSLFRKRPPSQQQQLYNSLLNSSSLSQLQNNSSLRVLPTGHSDNSSFEDLNVRPSQNPNLNINFSSHNLTPRQGDSPPLSPVSNVSLRSDGSSCHTAAASSSSVGDKLSAKWQIRRQNFDKNEERDARLLEFSKFLADKYYNAFNYNWQELAELYLFGGTIASVFSLQQHKKQGDSGVGHDRQLHNVLLNWLLHGGDQHGEEQFTLLPEFAGNMDIYSLDDASELASLLRFFAPLVRALEVFKMAISYFKENTDNDEKLRERSDKVEVLESVANKRGVPIPLSQVLFGNWLIQFNSADMSSHPPPPVSAVPGADPAGPTSPGEDNSDGTPIFTDENIVRYFRRSARNSLVLRLLYSRGYFNELMGYLEQLEQQDVPTPGLAQADTAITNQELHQFLAGFCGKDNQTALGLSLYGLANACHMQKLYNRAINVFEMAANLTCDLDCCAMAAVGLSNGYGFGKKHGKENKFHRKKRLAKIYRIIKENGGTLSVGTSWAFKDKYD